MSYKFLYLLLCRRYIQYKMPQKNSNDKVKILLANKFYYQRGGDCIYTLNIESLLRKHGHEVAIFSMQHSENLPSKWSKYFPSEIKFRPSLNILETFIRPFGLGEVRMKFNKLLDDFHPDVVHANNIHSQLSPVIMGLAKERGIRTVWTLHDYKLLCPRYDCRTNMGICELCFLKGEESKRNALKNCVRNKCIKGSDVGSFIGYWEAMYWNPVRLQIVTDAFICPSRFMDKKMEEGGFSPSKMHVLPNFIEVEKCLHSDLTKGDYYCYVGRLSEEKGLRTLVETANKLPSNKLVIVGDGPMLNELQRMAKENIVFTGRKSWKDLKPIVSRARFMVIPSEWYENCPLSVIESLCLGTPVLGARIGGIPELIGEPAAGLTFESGNMEDLTTKIEQMFDMGFDYENIAEMSRIKYDAETYYNLIINQYGSEIKNR